MGEARCKPFSFYVPEHDTELMRFMAYQSNMSLSIRLLMKAFLAANRHVTDIDVSTVDLADLIKSVQVDPASLPGGMYKGRGSLAVQDAREAGFITRHEQRFQQEGKTVQETRAAVPEEAPAASHAERQAAAQAPVQEQPVQQREDPVQEAAPGTRSAGQDAVRQPVQPAPRQAEEPDDLDPASLMGDF